MNKISIKVVAAHFGPLPATFSLWLRSVSHNPSVNFILITDQIVSSTNNLNVIQSDMNSFRKSSEERLATRVALFRPYKICDLRPMYGVILEDVLGPCDFWGHCDLDVVFGDIRSFLTDEVLGHDKILVRGNFALYKNCSKLNNAFREGESLGNELNWKYILADDKNRIFDEWRGIYRILVSMGVQIYNEDIIADILPSKYGLRRTSAEKDIIQELFYWQDGRICGRSWTRAGVARDKEFLLIHLQKRSLSPPSSEVMTARRIYFRPDGFVAADNLENVNLGLARTLNPSSLTGDLRIFAMRAQRMLNKKLFTGVNAGSGRSLK